MTTSQFQQFGGDEAAECLLDIHGEPAEVTPDSGIARPVTVYVDRNEPTRQGDGGVRMSSYRIAMRNSNKLGMTADEALQSADSGLPTIRFRRSAGDTDLNLTRSVNRVTEQTAGMIMVEVML